MTLSTVVGIYTGLQAKKSCVVCKAQVSLREKIQRIVQILILLWDSLFKCGIFALWGLTGSSILFFAVSLPSITFSSKLWKQWSSKSSSGKL